MVIRSLGTRTADVIKSTFRTLHLVQHRFERSPTFSSQKLSEYACFIPFYADHSPKPTQLRDVLSTEIAKDPSRTTSGVRIDIMPWLSRMTLDSIGLAGKLKHLFPDLWLGGCHRPLLGFNYDFDALNVNEKPNELNEAFSTMVAAGQRPSVLPILQSAVPAFAYPG